MSLSYFGVDAFRAAIDRSLDLAARAERLIESRPELELLSPAQLGIVCFRRRFASAGQEEWQSARLNAALVGRFEQSGLGLVSSVIERWDAARDFYVIIGGEAEVLIDGEYVRHLARGDFFGEVAALEWGSEFGYVRTATVVAATDLRLLALAPAPLAVLIRGCPALGETLQAAARERMPRM
jgi:CRP-like cAMP-binding protein